MKMNREPKSKSIHLQPTGIRQKIQIYTMEKRHSSVSGFEENWITSCKRMKIYSYVIYTNQLKWIKCLNMRNKIMKLLEENWSGH